jgi:hypothetical protein
MHAVYPRRALRVCPELEVSVKIGKQVAIKKIAACAYFTWAIGLKHSKILSNKAPLQLVFAQGLRAQLGAAGQKAAGLRLSAW